MRLVDNIIVCESYLSEDAEVYFPATIIKCLKKFPIGVALNSIILLDAKVILS